MIFISLKSVFLSIALLLSTYSVNFTNSLNNGRSYNISSIRPTLAIHKSSTYFTGNEACGINFGRIVVPNCSRTLNAQHIVGGSDTDTKPWPWMIFIFNNGYKWCGGALIHPRFILTAAHCTEGKEPEELVVYGGLASLKEINNSDSGVWWMRNSKNLHVYPAYNPLATGLDNDISVIELESEVPLSQTTNLVCLPSLSDNIEIGQDCYHTGYGATYEAEKDERLNLQQACLPIIGGKRECAPLHSENGFSNNMICAGYLEGFIDSCGGDSGGPLVCQKDGKWKVVGLSSWGNQTCGQANSPGVFTKVDNYLVWIRNIINRSS